jgi:carbon monoxide dehydrogenase subunit G
VELEHRFAVKAPLEQSQKLLLDLERVAPCLPGAEITERLGDDRFAANMSVRIGPIRMTYRGEIWITEVDRINHHSTMRAEARDSRGRGSVKAEIAMRLSGAESGTDVEVSTSLSLTGRVAQMGRSVVQDTANELLDRFVENVAALAAEMQAGQSDAAHERKDAPDRRPARPPSALAMLARIIRARLRRGLARLKTYPNVDSK